MTDDRELTGDEAQRALSEAVRRIRGTVPVADPTPAELIAFVREQRDRSFGEARPLFSALLRVLEAPSSVATGAGADWQEAFIGVCAFTSHRAGCPQLTDAVPCACGLGAAQMALIEAHYAVPVPLPDAAPSPDYKALYYELLFAVGHKYPGESRHETAMRYIRRAEQSSGGPVSASPPATKGE